MGTHDRRNECVCARPRVSAWRTGTCGKLANGKLAMANWHMAKLFMAKRHIPQKFYLDFNNI